MVEQTLKRNFCGLLLQLDVWRSASFLGFKNQVIVGPDVRVALRTGSLHAAVLVFGEIVAQKKS